MTDQELIQRARSGDTKAFEELVKRFEPQVAATVIGMLGKCEAADDVGQEVFIRFYKVMHRFRGDATLGSYLTRIAINLSINELKRRKRRQLFFIKSEDGVLAEPSYNPSDEITTTEKTQWVQHAIQRLDTKFRSVVVLRMIDGYSTEETAKILGLPLGTVLSRLSRAQKKLKKLLTPYVEEEL